MTVEVKNLEADFIYIKDECVEDKDKAGLTLRIFGRRLLNLADEFIPHKINSMEWKKYQLALKSSIIIKSKASLNGKPKYPPKHKSPGYSSPPPPPPQSTALSSSITKTTTTIKSNNTQNDAHPTIKRPVLRA